MSAIEGPITGCVCKDALPQTRRTNCVVVGIGGVVPLHRAYTYNTRVHGSSTQPVNVGVILELGHPCSRDVLAAHAIPSVL